MKPIPPSLLAVTCLLLVAISGCATSTGVVSLGKDTYMIAGSQPGFVGTGEVKARLIRQASKWCAERNLVMQVVDATGVDGVAGHNEANANVTFKALSPSQAAQAGPVFQQPTQVIETRAR